MKPADSTSSKQQRIAWLERDTCFSFPGLDVFGPHSRTRQIDQDAARDDPVTQRRHAIFRTPFRLRSGLGKRMTVEGLSIPGHMTQRVEMGQRATVITELMLFLDPLDPLAKPWAPIGENILESPLKGRL